MDEAINKKRFRKEALQKRDCLTAKEREAYSEAIVKRLVSLPDYGQAKAVLTYISYLSEVDTFPLLERAFSDKKAVFAPKVSGRQMEFIKINGAQDLALGYRGILEPEGTTTYTDWVSRYVEEEKPRILICMPGAAFDRRRHRIGYGGGFYDRYLSGLKYGTERKGAQVTAVALSYACQIFAEIPWEIHDICPERIITETEII